MKAAAKAAVRIENAKRTQAGQDELALVKVLSGQSKRAHGTKYKLVLQARTTDGIQTYNVDVWHQVERTALGDITSNKYSVSKFEDSDASFITAFESSGEDDSFKGRLTMFGDDSDTSAGDAGDKTATCSCPPALAEWKCTQPEYDAIVSGKRCDYFKAHKFGDDGR